MFAAGVAALLAAAAWLASALIEVKGHQALDLAAPPISDHLLVQGRALVAASQVCLLPAALVLHLRLVPRHRCRIRTATSCGVASLVIWSYAVMTTRITRPLEVTCLALAGIWWCALSLSLRPYAGHFAALTLALGVFALWDALLTTLEPLPVALYATAAPKLLLSFAWNIAVAWELMRTPTAQARVRPRSSSSLST
ncbi:MAG: hypothetical protein NVS1B4_19990 [Gemmatimonadaceae bacterium]